MNKEIHAPTSLADLDPKMREVRLKAARRIVQYAKEGKTDLAPGVMQEDPAFFVDPEIYKREHQKFFIETPLVVCLSKDLAEPGSYRLFEETGVPIVVWRGQDNKVRGFLNICAHRGARLFRQPCGKANRLTCRFHGWTYDPAGEATGVPEEQYFCGEIDKQKHLVAVPTEERHGLVFVQATPNGKMDLDTHLGTFGPELEALGFANATRVIEDELTTPSNWKYALDTNFENYHLPVLHRETFGSTFAMNLNVFETWGPHHRFTFPHGTIYDWVGKPESEWPIGSLPFLYFLFPNVNIAVGSVTKNGSLVSISRIFPTSVGSLVTKIAVYAPNGVQSQEHHAEIEKSFGTIRRAIKEEDYSVTGESWSALSHLPPGSKFPVGRQELGVQNFHNTIRRFTRG